MKQRREGADPVTASLIPQNVDPRYRPVREESGVSEVEGLVLVLVLGGGMVLAIALGAVLKTALGI